jgi:hypothetical protein
MNSEARNRAVRNAVYFLSESDIYGDILNETETDKIGS